jgi:hypothetical protein
MNPGPAPEIDAVRELHLHTIANIGHASFSSTR